MNGLLLRLLETGEKQPRFWKLFSAIRQDLDRLYWCFPTQPWMCWPVEFHEEGPFLEDFDHNEGSGVTLWRPGSLSRFADQFKEEYFDFWAIEPTQDDPQKLAANYDKTYYRNQDKFIHEHARIWLLYTDSSCWEIYARKTSILIKLREAIQHQRSVSIYQSESDHRGRAFVAAGLSVVWRNLNGNI